MASIRLKRGNLQTMGFFGTKKKKSDNVKTLTETEIQQRLYGHLRVPSTAVEDFGSEAAPPQSPSSFAIRRPSDPSKDLFVHKTPQATSEKTGSGAIAAGPLGQKGSWSESSPAINTSFQNKGKAEKAKNPFVPVLRLIGGFAKNALSFLLMAVFKLIEAIFRFFIAIDFRKPQVKRIASALGAVGFIGLLLLGTYFLNVQREAAMKSPHRKSFAPYVQKEIPAADSASSVAKPVENTDSTGAADHSAPVPPPQEGTQPAEPSVKTPKAKTAEQGVYSIQIATFAGPEDAGRLVAKLREQDADAFVKQLERPGGKTYYCVFVGHYKDPSEAEENLGRFKKKALAKPFQDAFVRALRAE